MFVSASPLRATLIGAVAIALWSTFALLTTFTRRIPALEVLALTFAVGGAFGLLVALVRGRPLGSALRQPKRAWALGVGGLFGYHLLYFTALRLAPDATVEVGLLNYLWPLLIVLFAALLPGGRLKPQHLVGALLGLCGTAMVAHGGAGALSLDAAKLPAFGAALAAAVVWAGYSVLTRRFGEVPSEAVAGLCLATAALAALCHLALEPTVIPDGREALAIALIGAGPVGAAFYVWDHGVKHGELQLLGSLSYVTPLASTLLLVQFGGARATPWLALAGALIVLGAILASREGLRRW